jgi:ABC-2 type transport system permease protein
VSAARPPITRTGSIYDLGYRRYEGPRLGRGAAIRSLIGHSFRSTYGIGRGGRSKIAPFVFGAMAVLPAIVIVGVLTIASRFGNYFSAVNAIIALFCAAQAPELFGRDQRHGVLPLYFARALRRSDYALGRLIGFWLGVLALLMTPMVILFVGKVLLSTDIAASFADNLPNVPPVLAQALILSALYGGLAMVVSAFTPRRAYATAGIIALFIVPGLVTGIVIGIGSSGIGTVLTLIAPNTVIDGTNALFFGHELGSEYFFVDLPLQAFLVAALVEIAIVVVLVVRRFARLTA